MVLLLLLSCFSVTVALHCVDHNNNAVDWYVVYKLPEIKHHGKLLKQGAAYTYATSSDLNNWKLSSFSINDTNSIVGLTLQPFYNNPKDKVYILYNDEPPDKPKNQNKGHTKGVVLGDKDGGIWLVHSVPNFPPPDKKYIYPRTGAVYGQSFLCISLDLKNLDIVGTQLQYNEPEIYTASVPQALKKSLPNIVNAVNNITVKKAPWYHTASIVTKGDANFISYAKSKHFNKDLYADWLAVSLNSDLMVETWPNGQGRLPSKCSNHSSVYNVESVNIATANVTFTSTSDHSKWAVAKASESANWICIGDINRMESQKKRGGGTVCLNNKRLALLYQKSVADFQKC